MLENMEICNPIHFKNRTCWTWYILSVFTHKFLRVFAFFQEFFLHITYKISLEKWSNLQAYPIFHENQHVMVSHLYYLPYYFPFVITSFLFYTWRPLVITSTANIWLFNQVIHFNTAMILLLFHEARHFTYWHITHMVV